MPIFKCDGCSAMAWDETRRYCDGCKEDGTAPGEAPAPSEGIGELIERLVIANIKLAMVCDKKAKVAGQVHNHGDTYAAVELEALIRDDLNLCKSRAAIRADLNRRLGCEVSGESVKHYGS